MAVKSARLFDAENVSDKSFLRDSPNPGGMPTDRLRRATLVAALLAATALGVAALDAGQGVDACACDGAASAAVDARRGQPNLTLTPTPTPTETPTPTATPTETPDPTETPAPTPTESRTATPARTPTPAGTTTGTATPSTETPPTGTRTEGGTPSPTPDRPVATATAAGTPTPAATPSDDGDDGGTAGESLVLVGLGGLVVVGSAGLALREFRR